MSDKFRELAKSVEAIGSALRVLENLDYTEREPHHVLDRLSVVRSSGYNMTSPDEKAMADAMKAGGLAFAQEEGRKARAAALATAIATIHSHRAIFCSLAASATVELAKIVRDAQEKG